MIRYDKLRKLETMSDKIVQFNEEVIKGQLKELVRGSVEETLNELLEKEGTVKIYAQISLHPLIK